MSINIINCHCSKSNVPPDHAMQSMVSTTKELAHCSDVTVIVLQSRWRLLFTSYKACAAGCRQHHRSRSCLQTSRHSLPWRIITLTQRYYCWTCFNWQIPRLWWLLSANCIFLCLSVVGF